MGILYLLAYVAAGFAAPALTGMAVALLGLVIRRCMPASRPGRRQQRDTHPPRVERPLPPGWGWVIALSALAAFTITMVKFPNQAELRHFLDKGTGYPSTRIEVLMRQDSPAHREEILHALLPVMRSGTRAITYRIHSHQARSSFTVTDLVPTYYRFLDGKLQIAMGGILDGESGYVLKASLEALEAPLPGKLPARLEMGGKHFDVFLRPGTTEIIADDATQRTRRLREGSLPGGQCHLRMQVHVPVELARTMFGGQFTRGNTAASHRVVPADASALGIGSMQLLRIYPVPGAGGRTFTEVEGDPFQLVGWADLVPEGLDRAQLPDCGRELLRRSSPSLRRAMLDATGSNISGMAASASVEPHARFSPWYAGSSWQKVAPDGPAGASRHSCGPEARIRQDVQVGMIYANCSGGNKGPDCEPWVTLMDNAIRDQRLCRRGEL